MPKKIIEITRTMSEQEYAPSKSMVKGLSVPKNTPALNMAE